LPPFSAMIEEGKVCALNFPVVANPGLAKAIGTILVRIGTIPQHAMKRLEEAVEQRRNILISGGAGSGKTTMLNALASFIDPKERVVLIEDISEVQISLENLVEFHRNPGRHAG